MVAEKQWEFAANVSIPEWIVVVPGVIPQVRGYRSEGKKEEVDRVASWRQAVKTVTFTHTGATRDLPVSVARSRLDEIVDGVRARHEAVFLTLRGCRVAAVIDVEEVDRLSQAAEDLADLEAADAARAEIAKRGTIPWDEVKADLGLA